MSEKPLPIEVEHWIEGRARQLRLAIANVRYDSSAPLDPVPFLRALARDILKDAGKL